jgi:hypothetical protein
MKNFEWMRIDGYEKRDLRDNGKFFIARTFDDGSNWRLIHYEKVL